MIGPAMGSSTLFLVWHDAPGTSVELAEPSHPLAAEMFLLRSERSLSRVYHAVKHQLPPDTALCVAPLAQPPKFKGLAAGALKWLRSAQ